MRRPKRGLIKVNKKPKKVHKKSKRGPGRPATGQAPLISVRVHQYLLDEIEEWARSEGLSRSEALRALIENGLTMSGRFSFPL
jgi:Ribbon-helix-helix protein, copG family